MMPAKDSPQRTQRTRRRKRLFPFASTTLPQQQVLTFVSLVSLVVICLLLTVVPAFSQMTGTPAAGYKREAGVPSSALPAPLREIGFDQNLDRLLPPDIPFADEQGRPVRVGDYFGGRPVVLAFVYYDCPLLCMQVLNALASALDVLSLQPGKDFDVVTISFDPREKPALAAAKKEAALQRYKRPGAAAAWHFLTGEQSAIERATRAAGLATPVIVMTALSDPRIPAQVKSLGGNTVFLRKPFTASELEAAAAVLVGQTSHGESRN